MEGLSTDVEQRVVQPGVQLPTVAQPDVVFGIECELMSPVGRPAPPSECIHRLLRPGIMPVVGLLRTEEVVEVCRPHPHMVVRAGTVVQLGMVTDVVDGRAAALLLKRQLPTVFARLLVILQEIVVGAVVGIQSADGSKETGRPPVLPVERRRRVAPLHVELHVVEILVIVLDVTVVMLLAVHLEEVVARIETERGATPVGEDVRHLRIDVVEGITHVELVSPRTVVGGKERSGKCVEPCAPHCHVERGPALPQRTFQLKPSVEQSQTEGAVQLLQVAVVGTYVDHRRQTSAIACRETALVEVDVLHDVGVEGREQTAQVVHLVERRPVEQEEVLVVASPVDIQPRNQFRAGSPTVPAGSSPHPTN